MPSDRSSSSACQARHGRPSRSVLWGTLGVLLALATGCNRASEKPAAKSSGPAPSTAGAPAEATPVAGSPTAESPAAAAASLATVVPGRESRTGSAAPGASPATRPGGLLGRDSAPDIEALLDSVAARIHRRDTVGLVRLMVDDPAWRRHLWPLSNGFDPESEDAFRFVLAMHKANSAKGLRRVLADAVNPDGSPAPLLRGLEAESLPGAVLYHVRPGEGVRPFGSALCAASACRVATFAQPGAARRARGPAGNAPMGG